MQPSNALYGRSRPEDDLHPVAYRAPRGGSLVLDTINTVDRHTGVPAYDYFAPGYANVLAWLVHARIVPDDDAHRLLRAAQRDARTAASVRRRLIALREALYRIIRAVRTDAAIEPANPDLDLLNAEVAEARHHGRYAMTGGVLRWSDDDPRDLALPLRVVALAAIDLLGSQRDLARIGQCQGDGCEWLFLDRSKNGSRRFCSSTGCGNTTRVRRFRDRQRADATSA